MNCKKHFFGRNVLIVDELLRYAPSDDELLAIPFTTNVADPFLSSFCGQIADRDPWRNNILVGTNLLFFLQYVNQILSRLYAACRFIVENYEKPIPRDLSQLEIDLKVHIRSCIFQEYQYSFREFILMLKIVVDQLIILLPSDLKNGENCDCIGKFLGAIRESQTNYLYDNRKFLVGLNAAANYLKYHPYQFENPSLMLHLDPPSLLVMVKNNDKEKDCLNLKEFFTDQLQYSSNNHHILCLISWTRGSKPTKSYSAKKILHFFKRLEPRQFLLIFSILQNRKNIIH